MYSGKYDSLWEATEKSSMLVYVNSALLACRENTRIMSSCGTIHYLDKHCYPGVRHFVLRCHLSLETVTCPGVVLVFSVWKCEGIDRVGGG
jgi:hypothetical protein